MNKKFQYIIFSLIFVTGLAACGRRSGAPKPTSQPVESAPGQAQATQQTVVDLPATTPVYELPQSFEVVNVAGAYQFTEGPAADASGNVFFSDINAGKIYKWSPDGSVTVLFEGLNEPNGLIFDQSGNLIVCEGGNGRLISIDPQGQITVLVEEYNGMRFNKPNDLWIDPRGGIYFSDPAYQSSLVQDGEHVYYLSPDRSTTTRVIDNMTRPNGLVGTDDGKTLYVADHGAGQTFVYDINSDGTLANKRLFASTGSDGMDLDASGNLYLTTRGEVQIYDVEGNLLGSIPTRENPTNVAFAGADRLTLFITARSTAYTVSLSPESSTGVEIPAATDSSFTLTSSDLPADNRLPTEFTCDGESSTLALSWKGEPEATQEYAVIMHHIPGPGDSHWYWVIYNIPADVTSLPKNMTGIGTLGTNSVNGRNEYAPPCSKGPGDKEYIYTVYALSAQPQVGASKVNRDALLNAIKDITLASAELHVVYARP